MGMRGADDPYEKLRRFPGNDSMGPAVMGDVMGDVAKYDKLYQGL
jgi:hypothetical protein